MLRVSIRATPDTDVALETQNLRRAAKNAGVEPGLIDRIVKEAHTVVQDLVNRGRELKSLGSQMKVKRTIRGDGYDIQVSFDTVSRVGLLERVLRVFRR